MPSGVSLSLFLGPFTICSWVKLLNAWEWALFPFSVFLFSLQTKIKFCRLETPLESESSRKAYSPIYTNQKLGKRQETMVFKSLDTRQQRTQSSDRWYKDRRSLTFLPFTGVSLNYCTGKGMAPSKVHDWRRWSLKSGNVTAVRVHTTERQGKESHTEVSPNILGVSCRQPAGHG